MRSSVLPFSAELIKFHIPEHIPDLMILGL